GSGSVLVFPGAGNGGLDIVTARLGVAWAEVAIPIAVPARAAPVAPVAAVEAVTPVAAALALIAIRAAHHRRGSLLVLVDPDGKKANDVGREAHLTSEVCRRRRRRVDVQQREMRLAILLDAEGEALEPPIFGLADDSAAALDDVAKVLYQAFDLLCGDVLASQEHMLIKWHGTAFP